MVTLLPLLLTAFWLLFFFPGLLVTGVAGLFPDILGGGTNIGEYDTLRDLLVVVVVVVIVSVIIVVLAVIVGFGFGFGFGFGCDLYISYAFLRCLRFSFSASLIRLSKSIHIFSSDFLLPM